MGMTWDIDTDEKKEQFVAALVEQAGDWEDNPTLKVYNWVDWSYDKHPYALKIQYRVCDPRLDRAVEKALLKRHEETHITMFKWPVPVAVDHLPKEGDYPSRIGPSEILVYMRVASFCAKCRIEKYAIDIMERVLKRRK